MAFGADRSDHSDNDWLAPVTYLPGVAPVSAEATPEESPRGARRREHARTPEDVAVRALARRGLSRREVERELAQHDIDEDVIAEEVDRLEERGWVDDMALAQDLVARLQERKGYGRQAIAAELARRLLAPAAIEYALDLVDAGEEQRRAEELALKRIGQLRGLDRETQKRRLSSYLARRGYSGSTVRAAIDHALASE